MKKAILTVVVLLTLTGMAFAQHFVPEWKVNPPGGQAPYLAHNVFVYGVTINGTPWQSGWEIGIFDEGGTCVGSIDNDNLYEPGLGYISLRCSPEGGDVPGSATLGDFIIFKVWDGTTEYSYPEMAVEFYEPPTADPTPASDLEFVAQGTTFVQMIQYETPENEFTTGDITVPAGNLLPITDLDFGNTGFTLVNGTLVNLGTVDITDNISVYTFDENSVDTYYNETDPNEGTVPVMNYSSYGWVVDSGELDFISTLTYTFDLSTYGPSFSDPNDLLLLHRPIHGTSYYIPVETYTYDELTQTITVSLTSPSLFSGEYIIGSLNPEDVLPVELSSFTATMNNSNNAVNLVWVSQTETGMVGYRIYRGETEELSEALDLNVLIEATNTSQPTTYMYSDTDVQAETTYNYWLEALDLDGTSEIFGPIFIETPSQSTGMPDIPLVTGLTALYPNPFNPDLTVNYSVDSKLPVEIQVFNSRGQKIKTLVNEIKETGYHSHVWNGHDEMGRQCSSGIYHIIMKAGGEQFNKKAILLK